MLKKFSRVGFLVLFLSSLSHSGIALAAEDTTPTTGEEPRCLKCEAAAREQAAKAAETPSEIPPAPASAPADARTGE